MKRVLIWNNDQLLCYFDVSFVDSIVFNDHSDHITKVSVSCIEE